jgi:uncharacterized membrane protein
MKPLIVLVIAFAISLLANKIFRSNYEFALSGRIAMSAMVLFTAVGHFAFNKGMTLMLPNFIPFKTETVYLTGIIEIAAAIGLFIPNLRVVTAWLLIIFFILILPANIYASIKHVDYQKETFDGHGLTYLWFRIPLQVLFIVWIYLSSIKG